MFTLFKNFLSFSTIITFLIFMSSCSSLSEGERTEVPKSEKSENRPSGSIFTGKSEAGISLDEFLNPKSSGTGSMPVNAILWRAALDTVSVVPIDDIDTFGGTILTEWYPHPSHTDQRIKIAVFVIDRELRADAIRVLVYVQQNQGSNWIDIGQDADFARRMEDLILTRAREIRSANILNTQ